MKKKCLVTAMALAFSGAGQAQTMVPAIDKTASVAPDFVEPVPKKNLHLSAKELHALKIAREWKDMPNKPHRSADGSVKYLYGTTLPTLICKPLQVCVITLQEGEVIKDNGIHVGDPRWLNSPAMSGSGSGSVTHITLKPTDYGLPTNMVIITNRRVYTIKLVAANHEWMPFLSFDYPEDNDRAWAAYRESQHRVAHATTLSSGENIADQDFRFSITGDSPKWKPLRVYTNGVQTAIQFADPNFHGMSAPALFVYGKAGGSFFNEKKPIQVNYHRDKDRYIVDYVPDVGEQFALVTGVGNEQTKVLIEYQGGGK